MEEGKKRGGVGGEATRLYTSAGGWWVVIAAGDSSDTLLYFGRWMVSIITLTTHGSVLVDTADITNVLRRTQFPGKTSVFSTI